MAFKSNFKMIGRLLVDKGIINESQLSDALDMQRTSGKPLGQILVELGYAEEDQVFSVLSKKMGTTYEKDLASRDVPVEALESMPASVVHIYNVMPIGKKGNTLTVAMSDPCNVQIIDDLNFRLGMEINPVLAPLADIEACIARFYGEDGAQLGDMVGELTHEIEHLQEKKKDSSGNYDESSLKELANQAPVVKLLNLILIQAVQDKASDIHLEPFEDQFKVRYRVDGALYEMSPPPKSLALALISRVKVMANLDIAERRLPQDGRILMDVGQHTVDLRVSTLPTVYGESVVMRVLDKSVVSLNLNQIGMAEEQLKKFRELIRKPNGILLVTGPTGSGKTTTLYSALREINKIDYKIITTEDPVEYDIDGIIQVPIKPKIDLSFARCLRAILRQDPDIIMVGEIRDEETGAIAVQASLTGHLVFSTLHTNDAPGAITRMIDMGIEPFLITSSLEAIIAQRLVRTICKDCKEAYSPSDELLHKSGLTRAEIGEQPFYRGRGCETCNFTGYKGRTGIYEFLVVSDALKPMILERKPTVALRQKSQELGMNTLREDGLRKVFQGVTTIEEVVRETQQYS